MDVSKKVETKITSFTYDYSGSVVKFNIEVQNSGSIASSARVRIDLFNEESGRTANDVIFTAWGPEKPLMPGDRYASELYWYAPASGRFAVRARVYHANEITEEFFDMEKKPESVAEDDVFEVGNLRTYDDFIVFDLSSKKDARDVVIIPDGFAAGWTFEQKKISEIGQLGAWQAKTLVLPYHASIFYDSSIKLQVVSGDSKMHSEKIIELVKEQGMKKILFYTIDYLKILFNSAK